MPTLPEGGGWDFTALGVARECACWKACMRSGVSGAVDIVRLNAEINQAFGIAKSMLEIEKRVRGAKTQPDSIATYADDLRKQLEAVLSVIRTIAGDADSQAEAA